MKENPQNKEINNKETVQEEKQDINMKKGFFKKVWYSINKIEKYSELSAEGFGRAIKYLIILIIILGIVSSLATVYRTSLEVKNIAQYINENAPELIYNNETLTIETQEPIIDDNASFGKVIIDTITDDEQKINEYLNETQNNENVIIILKDRLILKEIGLQGTTNYNYKDLFGEMGITQFDKQDLIEYITGKNMIPLYLNLVIILFIYAFVIYIINTLFNVIIISIFGYLAAMILRLKIRYVAIFNMGIYAITLPTILDMMYIGINAFYRYNINYFSVMYILVASIYMIAAIFILKSEFNKKQGEVQKIIEVEKQIKEEMKETEKQKEEKENKDTSKNDKQEDKTKDTQGGEEPEGSNA